MNKLFLSVVALAALAIPSLAIAGEDHINTVAVQGYDVVSYHQGNGTPKKGDGNFVAYHNGATYLFATADNKQTFEANPAKYAPAYGGFCAYGVTKNKKFNGNPLAYKVVDGTLYLNLNKDVQNIWVEDIAGNISSADTIWPSIAKKHASEL